MAKNTVSRRTFLQFSGMATLVAGYLNAGRIEGSEAPAKDVSLWLDRLYANAGRLRAGEISSLGWQEGMDQIYGSVAMDGLKERLQFSKLSQKIIEDIPADRHELFHRVSLPGSSAPLDQNGKEPHRVLITKVAHIRKGHSVPPHGHSNMASAFLCLSGEFDVRLFDRIESTKETMVVRQSREQKQAGPGTWSSISDYRDNVHWLTAKTDDCFLFTSKLIQVEANRPLEGRINLNLHSAQQLGAQTWRAKRISSAEARELY